MFKQVTKPQRKWLVYCDESCQTGHLFMCIGGLWVRHDVLSAFVTTWNEIRDEERLESAPKWEKVSTQYYLKYQRLVDVFFQYARLGLMRFNAVVLYTPEFDHDTYNNGDEELGYYKFFGELLTWRIDDSEAHHYVIMDRRTNRRHDRLETLKTVLNYRLRKRLKAYPLVRDVRSGEIGSTPGLQLNDILLGAVSYHWNGKHLRPIAKEGKKKLAAYIAARVRRSSLAIPISTKAFNIWKFRLKEKK